MIEKNAVCLGSSVDDYSLPFESEYELKKGIQIPRDPVSIDRKYLFPYCQFVRVIMIIKTSFKEKDLSSHLKI
jgi:hypothetical protein